MLEIIKENLIKGVPTYLCSRGIECKVVRCEVQNLDPNKLAYHAASVIYIAEFTLEENGTIANHRAIVKTMPHAPIMRKLKNSSIQFDNEHAMYNDLIPLLLEKAAVYTENQERFDWWRPSELLLRCYYSSTGDFEHAMIVLEDLSPKGYKIRGHPVTLAMGYSDILIAIRALARFHALSYDLKWREPEFFKENVASKVEETRLFVTKPDREEWSHFKKFQHLSSLLPCPKLEKTDKEGKYRKGIQNLRAMMDDPKLLNDLLTPVEPLAVLCHGDFVMNNMLFKDDAVKLIDFQNSIYSSPFVDLTTFLFMHGGDFISRWDEMLVEYHSCLIRCLGRQPEGFSLEAFHEEFVRCGLFGYMISVPFLIFIGEISIDTTFQEQMKELPDDFEERTKCILKHLKLENEDTVRRVVALLREVFDRGMVSIHVEL